MHNMLIEYAEHGKFLHQFPSLICSRSQLIFNGGHCPWSDTRPGEPASPNFSIPNISLVYRIHEDTEMSYEYIYMKGLEAKGPFSCLGLQVRFRRAYQKPINYTFLWLVKY